ncbi:MAG: hypothetical protein OXC06_04950 [Acidimicrobiaceae bacterium]|nr:hypothetical protein [Acidimicrobiaceae bacterium]
MTSRPVLDRSAVPLPAIQGIPGIWEALIELSCYDQPEWTLVGGQMVRLHAAEHSAAPLRVSRDLDVVVNARIVAGALRGFVVGLEDLGFQLAGASPDGVAHRYVRSGVGIDVLAPEGLGPHADLTTTPPGRAIQAPGGTQALDRTELVPVTYAGRRGLIPRPSLLGAVVMKAAAVGVDDTPVSQQQDLALLLSLVADPAAMAAETTKKDRARLRQAGVGDVDHPVWTALEPDAADRARAAYRSLADPPSGLRGPDGQSSSRRQAGKQFDAAALLGEAIREQHRSTADHTPLVSDPEPAPDWRQPRASLRT